ncbi:MAG: hypothetical protein ABJH45_00265 [Paracoccaceae bacterium]
MVSLAEISDAVDQHLPNASLIPVKDAGYLKAYRTPDVLIERVKAAHEEAGHWNIRNESSVARVDGAIRVRRGGSV